jgi:hypothetical protein
MSLSPKSIQSWEELCARFVANFASAYQQHGVEAHLHVVRQKPGELLRAFISCFTKVRGTIPRISDASIITAFRQGVRDEKMLEKLATHDVESVTTLFSLADKCARAAEGRAWHSTPQDSAAQEGSTAATPRAVAKRRKIRTTVDKGRKLEPWSLQQQPEDRMRRASTRARKVVIVAHALYTQMPATVPLTAARFRSSRSVSASVVSRLLRMDLLRLAGGRARRRPPAAAW